MVPCFTTTSNFTSLKLGAGLLAHLVCALNTRPLLFHVHGCHIFSRLHLFVVPLQSSFASQVPAQVIVQPSPEYEAATAPQKGTNTAELCGGLFRFLYLNFVSFSFDR